jgi:hypothetical protein
MQRIASQIVVPRPAVSTTRHKDDKPSTGGSSEEQATFVEGLDATADHARMTGVTRRIPPPASGKTAARAKTLAGRSAPQSAAARSVLVVERDLCRNDIQVQPASGT